MKREDLKVGMHIRRKHWISGMSTTVEFMHKDLFITSVSDKIMQQAHYYGQLDEWEPYPPKKKVKRKAWQAIIQSPFGDRETVGYRIRPDTDLSVRLFSSEEAAREHFKDQFIALASHPVEWEEEVEE